MKALVVGATGATGRLLVEALLDRGVEVRVIVRALERLPESVRDRVELTEAAILDLSQEALIEQVSGCQAIASCLGHNLTLKGVFGQPRRLVTQAVRRLCEAARAVEAPTRFVLMNTTAVQNPKLREKRSLGERMAFGVIRCLLPPQLDNEQAARYLREEIGLDDPVLKWIAVRPDGLINQEEVTEYTIEPSPLRSPVFNAGKTSRVNVADFMARLVSDAELWGVWRGQMPVIYNTDSLEA